MKQINEVMKASVDTKDLETIKFLVGRNADAINDACDKDGNPPLMYAIKTFHYIKFIEFLLEQGADVNARNNDGQTPLIFAMIAHKVDLMKMLLLAGADVNARLSDGDSVLTYIDGQTTCETVQLLLDAGASLSLCGIIPIGILPLQRAIQSRNFKVAMLLINSGIDVKSTGRNDNTPLYWALSDDCCDYHFVEALIYKYPDVNARESFQNISILEQIIYNAVVDVHKYVRIIDEIIRWGLPLDLTSPNPEGKTPLEYLKDRHKQYNPHVYKELYDCINGHIKERAKKGR